MKNPERVVELLAELRELTESDFERHRIDVLERDLHEPPKAEIIDDKKQVFGGLNYYIVKKGHFRSSQYIHQSIWVYYHGEIPEGCDIHHLDGNKANNEIENLQCVTHANHCNIHNDLRKKKMFVCEVCGCEYEAFDNNRNKFCSPQCAHSARNKRREKETICAVCGQKFYSRRTNARFCSKKCAGVARVTPDIKRICPVCGREFILPKKHKEQIYCSKTCAIKATWHSKD